MTAPLLTLSTTPAIDREALVLELDQRIDTPALFVPTPTLSGDLMEIEGPALAFFRYATPSQGRPVIIDIPRDLCSPAVRGKLYDLLVAVEREEVSRDARCVAAAGPAMLLDA